MRKTINQYKILLLILSTLLGALCVFTAYTYIQFSEYRISNLQVVNEENIIIEIPKNAYEYCGWTDGTILVTFEQKK